MANIKAETIEQFGGFGNLIPKSPNEHFRSCGFVPSANGMVAGRSMYTLTSGRPTHYTQSEFSNFNAINAFADGYGRDEGSSGGSDSFMFALNDDGEVWQSLAGVATPQLVMPFHKNGSHFSSGGIGGMIVDQKKRLLCAGQRYLAKFDPTVSEGAGSADFTNASDTIINGAGDAFVAGDVGKFLRVFGSGGVVHYYRIKTFTSGTAIKIFSTCDLSTGTYSYYILRSWEEQWKDFGSNFTQNSENYSAYTPCETYEDTVLFGRGSNITSLNTLTDTITTDASPAFNMPDGFDCLAIHKGANGVLIASNFQRKGVLILWDNFSDRSIAPWIHLGDRIVSVCKYNGGWIVITTREIFYTNGYSITPLIDSFLDSTVFIYASNLHPQTSFVIENDLYCTLGVSYNGKRRAGVYKINLTSKLAHYIPRADMNQTDERTNALFYGGGNGSGRGYVGTTNSWDAITYDTEPTIAHFITNPVGKGDNWKHAEAIKLNLGISGTYYNKDETFSFTITAKIAPMRKQMVNYGQLKIAMATNYDRITVNETIHYNAQVGEEVEFLGGLNKGYSRTIMSKTGAGTATAVWIFDRVLPNLDTDTSSLFFVYPFELIKTKTYTNITEMPEIWFDIKNKVKGKKFRIKFDIEGATVPIELRPFLFIYDDLGIL